MFDCPVYISQEDQSWLNREITPGIDRRLIKGVTEEILPGVTAIKLGGHFPGSLVLHWEDKLFVADTLVTIPVCYRLTSPPSKSCWQKTIYSLLPVCTLSC